jgi:predicted nucleic acid-binding protein
MSGNNNAIFIDTNVLVYASVVSAPLHEIALQTLHNFSNTGKDLWISRQVLREYLATLSRSQSFTVALAPEILVADIHYFQNEFFIAEENVKVTQIYYF